MLRRFTVPALALSVLTGVLAGCTAAAPHSPVCAPDALVARSLHDLAGFTGWLQRHGVRGVVGEVGWPGEANWQALASNWAQAARTAGVGAMVWAGAEQWPADYPMAAYRAGSEGGPLDTAGPQAAVVEREFTTGPAPSGVALAGGAFGASLRDGGTYSSASPGIHGQDYRYPSAASLGWLADRGVRTVRLSFTWERVQQRPSGPLNGGEVGHLRAVLRAARTFGLSVVLDLHSYGRFAFADRTSPRQVLELGSTGLPEPTLAQLWRELAAALGDEPALVGYGLMNEPHDLPEGIDSWKRASQGAVTAIRQVDRDTDILVAGYSWSSAARWAREHTGPWISDPAGRVLYEAHQYFDAEGSGVYGRSYAAELQLAIDAGWSACGPPPA